MEELFEKAVVSLYSRLCPATSLEVWFSAVKTTLTPSSLNDGDTWVNRGMRQGLQALLNLMVSTYFRICYQPIEGMYWGYSESVNIYKNGSSILGFSLTSTTTIEMFVMAYSRLQ